MIEKLYAVPLAILIAVIGFGGGARSQAINATNGTVTITNVIINGGVDLRPSAVGGNVAAPLRSEITAPAWIGEPGDLRPSLWQHNGSVVALAASGNRRWFRYHHPRAGMVEAGAQPGALLFEGARVRDMYIGTAYVFAGRCGTFAYRVSGYVEGDRRVVVNGLAPRIDQRDCRVVDERRDVLAFDLM